MAHPCEVRDATVTLRHIGVVQDTPAPGGGNLPFVHGAVNSQLVDRHCLNYARIVKIYKNGRLRVNLFTEKPIWKKELRFSFQIG
jgi:predicted transcriptional regulator